jgi:glycerol-3-phosphate cytidylyltransferase
MKKGFACGVFDLFHAGHVLMLKECREHCEYLVVALNTCEEIDFTINPGKEAPIFSLEERKLILESCRYVDEVVTYSNEEELYRLMRDGGFSIRFLGEDYRNKPITGPDLPMELFFNSRSHGLSTSGYKRIIRESVR